jgi:YegS/Rv2252/BmrU family lipid kinase
MATVMAPQADEKLKRSKLRRKGWTPAGDHAIRPGSIARRVARQNNLALMENGGTTPMEWVLIINPLAGGGNRRADAGTFLRELERQSLSCRHRFTERPRHAIEIIQSALAQGARSFIIAGGDGLLHEAVNAIFTADGVDPKTVTVAKIPQGSGNDWARTFNIPFELEGAVRVIRRGKTLMHDIGRVFYHVQGQERRSYFINMCGIGFDAVVNKRVAADRETGHLGPLKYRYHVLANLVGYAPTEMTFLVDGKQFKHEVFTAALGIGQYNGGGMKQLPQAVPDDGLFDLTVIRKISWMKALRALPGLYDGSFVGLPEVSTDTGKIIEVHSEPKCWLEADGEALGESPFRFEILPRALNVVVP